MKIAFLIAVFLLTSCGPAAKGTQLTELERLLQDPDANQVKRAPGAAKIYQEARQYRRLSLEAWDEGNEERSEEYAMLGWLKYRTASAIAEQNDAKQRLDTANARVSTVTPEMQALNNEQMKLTTEVAMLDKQVSLARSNNKSLKRNSPQADVDKKLVSRFNAKLIATEKAKNEAEAVNASQHASATMARANNQLKSVRSQYGDNNNAIRETMIGELDTAIKLFNTAKTQSAVGFKNQKAKSNPAARRSELTTKLKAIGGVVKKEANSVRAIFPGTFSAGSSSPNASLKTAVKKIAKLSDTFDEFQIRIEGFTSKGDATENLGLSQLRAKAVADILRSNGVNNLRIEDKGRGQDRLNYSGSENDRVEITFY